MITIRLYDIHNSINELFTQYPVEENIKKSVTTFIQTRDEDSIVLGLEIMKTLYTDLSYIIYCNKFSWIDFENFFGSFIRYPSRTANLVLKC